MGLQWVSSRWLTASNRLFECASTGSAIGGGGARAAHCPGPAARVLAKKSARPRGTGEDGWRRSRIFRRLMAARPPTRRAPAPAFCSRSPPTFLAHPRPVQCPPSCSAFPPRARGAKGRGSCVLRLGLVAGHGNASGGAPQRGIGRPRPCVSCRATSDAVELARRGGGEEKPDFFAPTNFWRLPFGFRALCKKCRQTPILILLLFPPLFPTFPHSPHSALGGGGGGVWRVLRPRGSTRLGFTFGGSSAALVGRIGALRTLCKKCRQTPIFTLLVF